jgi:hypothetical protein
VHRGALATFRQHATSPYSMHSIATAITSLVALAVDSAFVIGRKER